MQITLKRTTERLKGTYWRPVEHSLHQRETIESVRREVPGDQPNKLTHRAQTVHLDALDLLLAGSSRRAYTEARIEDPYKRDRFVEGFVYVRALAAFIHEDKIGKFEKMSGQIGPGAIISKAVEIEERASIGAYVELERGAQVMSGALIGPNTVLRKGVIVGEDTAIGAHSYLGQFSRIGRGVNIGSMSVIERGVEIRPDVDIGRQGNIGLDTYIGIKAWLDDSVHVGRHSYVGTSTSIGEMTTIGDRLHLGDGATVGAESRFGRFVRVAKNVMLISPTYAADGEFIAQSNLFARRPGLE
jgi:NDP-sugar pyrophosphorylase family protein